MKLQHFTQKKKIAADQPVALLVHDLTLELFLSSNGKHEKHKKRQQTGSRQDHETSCIADIFGPQRCGMEHVKVGTGRGNQSVWGLVLQLTASQQHTAARRTHIVCAVEDVLIHHNNQSYQLIDRTVRRRFTICKLQLFCAMQHYGWNGTLTNLLPTVLVPVRSVKCRVYGA